jgi:hypothetical protein
MNAQGVLFIITQNKMQSLIRESDELTFRFAIYIISIAGMQNLPQVIVFKYMSFGLCNMASSHCYDIVWCLWG